MVSIARDVKVTATLRRHIITHPLERLHLEKRGCWNAEEYMSKLESSLLAGEDAKWFSCCSGVPSSSMTRLLPS